jgi:glutamyl-tRNA synthetase
MNAEHLKQLPKEEFFKRGIEVLQKTNHVDWLKDEVYLKKIFDIVQEKLRSFEELPNFVAYFFDKNYPFEPTALQKILKHQPRERLSELQTALSSLPTFDCEAVENALKTLSAEKNLSSGAYIHTLRFAVSGRNVGPSLYHLLDVLGKDEVLRRIRRCLATCSFA